MPDGRSVGARKISPPPVFDPRTVQPVASRYAAYAIPAHFQAPYFRHVQDLAIFVCLGLKMEKIRSFESSITTPL
jgi:hypothetical protein